MDVIRKRGVFRLFDKHHVLILTDEKQLDRIIEKPGEPLFDDAERGFSGEQKGLYPPGTTLESFCENARLEGAERVEVSYDFFFGGTTRENYPGSEKTIKAFKVIHDYALKAGMTFGASLISPLDIGGGFAQKHDNTGFSWQFHECALEGGVFDTTMTLQRQWYNNKGPITLKLERVHAVAFDEERIGNSAYYYVDENAIDDISGSVAVAIDEGSFAVTGSGWGYGKMRVSGHTASGKQRALIVAVYRTPEQDYFDASAADYTREVIRAHKDAGIRYQGYYSDEMHIQFDWDLINHFGPTEITTRYVTPALVNEFARRYGDKYRNFLKYMVYFPYHQHGDNEASQHVFGKDPQGIYETWLFRKRYFEMLSRRVVDLSVDALEYSEKLFGAPIMTRAHATWQESPTCDRYFEEDRFSAMMPGSAAREKRYDYTPSYVWSSSIRENTAACYDYFRWNEFLTGSGNDHPEGGNTDRDYYAEALACSFGVLNRFPYAYCASWGSPNEVLRRVRNVGRVYGTAETDGIATGGLSHGLVQGMAHRDTDVLLLYPLELNYVEERFGSWMVQYGYGNYITEEKLLQYGRIAEDNRLEILGRKYRGVVVLFEPFVKQETLELLAGFVRRGGKLVWMAAPAVMNEETADTDVHQAFLDLFGLKAVEPLSRPRLMADTDVVFRGPLAAIPPMRILTDLLPDHVYALSPGEAEPVATADGLTIGALKTYVGAGEGGAAAYFGFRLRDDQSGSTGDDVSTLFAVLHTLGAYGPGSLEARSRPKDARYVMNTFPNGTVSLANHYRRFTEDWYGSFFRDEEKDRALLAGRTLPPVDILLAEEYIRGHRISYRGTDTLSYRLDKDGNVAGFSGSDCRGITIDGKEYTFADKPVTLTWTVVEPPLSNPLIHALLIMKADTPCCLTVPDCLGTGPFHSGACSADFYTPDLPVEVLREAHTISVTVTEDLAGKWIAAWIG
ncbi:MAG: hypothetical protein LBT00_00715 [Spirochaetaceae bacterium]|jgi:hypothetical protein|nr:hypothetical protein [Spirochaetaceae bacterium]